jgi:predicted alpha/beta hydrolase family esterase
VARREPLLLVAHSMGGLVARRWLQQDAAGARCVTGLLTVGSPHGGTQVARLGPGRAAAQMRPDARWLAELDRRPPPCPVRCLWSRIDGFVAPPASAVLAGSEAQELGGRGHFGMLRDVRLLPAIVDWMARCSRRRDSRDALAPADGSA